MGIPLVHRDQEEGPLDPAKSIRDSELRVFQRRRRVRTDKRREEDRARWFLWGGEGMNETCNIGKLDTLESETGFRGMCVRRSGGWEVDTWEGNRLWDGVFGKIEVRYSFGTG